MATAVFLGCMFSPPHLLDDTDAVYAQLGRSMLETGDWVTPNLDGVPFMLKPPLPCWLEAFSYELLGPHDWVARLWVVASVIGLVLLTTRFGRWAFGDQAGLSAGLALATCIGLWLFTRIIIPDAAMALTITMGMFAFLRALEEDENHTLRWALLLGASMGIGVLLKGLIAVLLPAGAGLAYLLLTGQLLRRQTWHRLHLMPALLVMLAIAAPWHVLATLRNPPYLDFTLYSQPAQYRGFFWSYFINEHLLRFLNMRYPHDYNTVPRGVFWVYQLLWLFPWSVFLPAAAGLSYRPVDRAGRTRLLALCWIGFAMVFFTFSTTQEYYSLPIYPALALLIGSAMDTRSRWLEWGGKLLAVLAAICAVTSGIILYAVRGVPTPGDISEALSRNPQAYTLSLGHMTDLTLRSFAYLRLPLFLAGAAFLIGALGLFRLRGRRAYWAMAAMMLVFLHAARIAMTRFDSYLSSYPLAQTLKHQPPGELIVQGYYTFSSVFFYTGRRALLLNSRVTSMEYGSYHPKAPQVFIGDGDLQRLWAGPQRCYLLAEDRRLPHLQALLGVSLHLLRESGGKYLFTNRE
ncbi:MAG TPA: glycosyltransferase family 39 protein [Terriglobales bacterium]|nr:glycosyltransferase family 39 protein [Terriglobales bacterium]